MAALNFKTDTRIENGERELLRDFCSELGGNIVELARAMGVKVFSEELWPYESGYLEYAPTCGSLSNYRIVINSRHKPERQRFTVAHELAHFLLHRDKSDFVVRCETRHRSDDYFEYMLDPGEPLKEREANAMAAAILLPPNLFVPAFQRLNGDLCRVAALFEVSVPAVQKRAKELGCS
ncbi:hypothetical protein ANTHELSMS3_03364 [Antarctobacter heliothermus]|uniref:IrrE N-terminal-like domain-containing protein n=1 Tax=Antarctobacter heliothermus TaxID=74033 RepID=A0A222E717_9RHOB|nr:ImmA/IrrE family metallo-endopeptidase [Antarctobacter heliothermus]ASP21997.1 hypothetical protein ANTHELSMS3_03364 [Antarctobacter heliothermus]